MVLVVNFILVVIATITPSHSFLREHSKSSQASIHRPQTKTGKALEM